jgi:hypothetical protein
MFCRSWRKVLSNSGSGAKRLWQGHPNRGFATSPAKHPRTEVRGFITPAVNDGALEIPCVICYQQTVAGTVPATGVFCA